jgi:hypothetical protein
VPSWTEESVWATAADGAYRVDPALIDGADHSYTGREEEVGRVLLGWLATL